MSNGVELIVANTNSNSKNNSNNNSKINEHHNKTREFLRLLTSNTNSEKGSMMLTPTTLRNQMMMVMPTSFVEEHISEDTNNLSQYIIKTCLTSYISPNQFQEQQEYLKSKSVASVTDTTDTDENDNEDVGDILSNSFEDDDEIQHTEETKNDVHMLYPSEIQNDFKIKLTTSATPSSLPLKALETNSQSDYTINVAATTTAAVSSSSHSAANDTETIDATETQSDEKSPSNSTQSLENPPHKNSDIKTNPPALKNSQKLEKLNSVINQNKFSSLKPVFNVISELLSNSFRNNYQQSSPQQQPHNLSNNNKTMDNATLTTVNSQKSNHETIEQQPHPQQPIYIPLAEQNYDLNEAESNQQFNYFPVNQVQHDYRKQSNILLNGGDGAGIKISPGEIKTANSDVIIGKPSILGPRITLQYNDDAILKPPALPLIKSPAPPNHPKVNLIKNDVQQQGSNNKYYVNTNEAEGSHQHPHHHHHHNQPHHPQQQPQIPHQQSPQNQNQHQRTPHHQKVYLQSQPHHNHHHHQQQQPHPQQQMKIIPVRQFSDSNINNNNNNAIRKQKFTLFNSQGQHPPPYQNKYQPLPPPIHAAPSQPPAQLIPHQSYPNLLQQQKQEQPPYHNNIPLNHANQPPRNNLIHQTDLFEIQQIPEVYSEDLPPTSVTYFPTGGIPHNSNELNKQIPINQASAGSGPGGSLHQQAQPTVQIVQHQPYVAQALPLSPPALAPNANLQNNPHGNHNNLRQVQPSSMNDIGLIPPPLPSPQLMPHQLPTQKFNGNRLFSQSQLVLRSSVKPLLVNIQPSRIANVLIPHGSTTALIFDGVRESLKTGQYFDDIAPHLESKVKFTSNVNKFIDNNEYGGNKDSSNNLQEQSSSQVSASVQFANAILNDKAPQQLTGETLIPQHEQQPQPQHKNHQMNNVRQIPQFQPQEIHNLYQAMTKENQKKLEDYSYGNQNANSYQSNEKRNEQNNNYQSYNLHEQKQQPPKDSAPGQQHFTSQSININDQHGVFIPNNKPIYTNQNINFDSHILNKDVNVVVPPLQFTKLKTSASASKVDPSINTTVYEKSVPYPATHIDGHNAAKTAEDADFDNNEEALQETNTHQLTFKNPVKFNLHLSDNTRNGGNFKDIEQKYNEVYYKSNRTTAAATTAMTPPVTRTTTQKTAVPLRDSTERSEVPSTYYHTSPFRFNTKPSGVPQTTRTQPFRNNIVTSTTPSIRKVTSAPNNKNIFLMPTPFLATKNTNSEPINSHYKKLTPFDQEQQQLSININNMENYDLKPPPLPAAIQLLPLSTIVENYSAPNYPRFTPEAEPATMMATISAASKLANHKNVYPPIDMMPPQLSLPSSTLVPPSSSILIRKTTYETNKYHPTKVNPHSFIINMTPPLPPSKQPYPHIPATRHLSAAIAASPTLNSFTKISSSLSYEPYYDTSINHSFKPIYDNDNKVSRNPVAQKPAVRQPASQLRPSEGEQPLATKQNEIFIETTTTTPVMKSIAQTIKSSTERISEHDYDDESTDIITAKHTIDSILMNDDSDSIGGSKLNVNDLIKPSTFFGSESNNFIITVKSSLPLLSATTSTTTESSTSTTTATSTTAAGRITPTVTASRSSTVESTSSATAEPTIVLNNYNSFNHANDEDYDRSPYESDQTGHTASDYDGNADEDDDIIITGESIYGSSQDLVRFIPAINNDNRNNLHRIVTSTEIIKVTPEITTRTSSTTKTITETTTTTRNIHKVTKIIKLVPSTVLKTILTTQTVAPTPQITLLPKAKPSVIVDYLNNHQTQNFRQKTEGKLITRPSNATTAHTSVGDKKNLGKNTDTNINSQFTHPQSDQDNFYVLLTENNLPNKNKKVYQIGGNGAGGLSVPVSANGNGGTIVADNRDEENIVKEPNRVLVGGILIASPPHVATSKLNLPQINSTNPHNYYHHNYYNEMNVLNINDCVDCKSSRNEYCKLVDKINKCVCRKGFSRLFPDRPCKPTYTYTMQIGLSHDNDKKLSYDKSLADTASPNYAMILSKAHDGLDRMIMQSDIRDVYHGIHINGFLHNRKENGDERSNNSEGIRTNFHIQLSENISEMKLKDSIRKYLKASNYSLGGTNLYADKYNSRIDIQDFDECLNGRYHDCSDNSYCFNLRGTYTCSCKEGYADLSENPVYPGRICSSEQIGCEKCYYHGLCHQNDNLDDIVCECFNWYTGSNCHINLKVLLIALGTLGIVLFTFLLLCSITACSSYRRHNRNNGTPEAMGQQNRQRNVNRNKLPQLHFFVKPNIDEQLILQPDNQSDRSLNSSFVNLNKIPVKRDVSKTVNNSSSINNSSNNNNLNNNNSNTNINTNSNNNNNSNNVILQQRTSQNSRDKETLQFNEQDKSVTVVIPRAKYHPFVQHISKNSSKNYLNYLDLDAENSSTQLMQSSTFEQRNKGALVSAGVEVSATVDSDMFASQYEYSNTLRKSCRTVSEARSCDETTIHPPTKTFQNNNNCNTMEKQSTILPELNKGNEEKDIDSIFLLPHTHLYKSDMDSEMSEFESF